MPLVIAPANYLEWSFLRGYVENPKLKSWGEKHGAGSFAVWVYVNQPRAALAWKAPDFKRPTYAESDAAMPLSLLGQEPQALLLSRAWYRKPDKFSRLSRRWLSAITDVDNRSGVILHIPIS